MHIIISSCSTHKFDLDSYPDGVSDVFSWLPRLGICVIDDDAAAFVEEGFDTLCFSEGKEGGSGGGRGESE